jgi:hypothetical protein
MKKETVHLISSLVWGIYGITVGVIGVVSHSFNTDVMVSVVVAIVGNSAHLMSMSFSKTGLTVSDQEKKVS